MLRPDRTLEQYWWTKETISKIIEVTKSYKRIACLGAPSLGLVIPERATVLDVDKRLKRHKNFIYFDMKHPVTLKKYFDLIVADPPYTVISGEELVHAIGMISSRNTKLLIVDNADGRDYVSFFRDRTLHRFFEVHYVDPQPESWYLWGDI